MRRRTTIILIVVLVMSALVIVVLLWRKASPSTPTCTVEEVLGQILSITPQQITVKEDSAGYTVALPLNEAFLGDEKISTTVYDDRDRPISLSDIRVGDWIVAHGNQCSTTLLTPEWIKKAHPLSK